MQRFIALNLQTPSTCLRRLIGFFSLPVLIIALAAISGCSGSSPEINTPAAAKPFSGLTLTIKCPIAGFGEALVPAANSWAERTGAKVAFVIEEMKANDKADIGVIDVAELGAWADRGDLAPVPASIRAPDHPYQWTGVMPAYRDLLNAWGGQALALPLAGDGYVIVYRADRLADPKFAAAFKAKYGRDPTPPASWEDFGDLAAMFTQMDGKPSLSALTADELASLFFRVASCHDRIAQTETINDRVGQGVESLAFQFDLTTGRPRLKEPSFVASADWLGSLASQHCLPRPAPGTTGEPAAALDSNQAVLAIVSLAQLAPLKHGRGAVPERYGIAPLPGSRRVNVHGKGVLEKRTVPNYIPYYSGGKLGVVRAQCPNPTAAFDLLAELGGPTRSLEIVSASGLGAGPFRISHLDRDRLQLWYGYGLDAARSDQLRKALLDYVRLDVKNPTYGLRSPDRFLLDSSAVAEMSSIATGISPDAALRKLSELWSRAEEKTPAETRLAWRRRAAGLD